MNDEWMKNENTPENGERIEKGSWTAQEEESWNQSADVPASEESVHTEQQDTSDANETQYGRWENTAAQPEEDGTYRWVNPKLRESEPSYDAYRFMAEEPTELPPVREAKKGGSEMVRLMKKFGLCAALAVVFGVISGLIILGITSLGGAKKQTVQIEETVPEKGDDAKIPETAQGAEASASAAVGNPGNTVADVAANSMPSVVAISNVGIQEVESFFGGKQSYESESSGSGIIVGQNDSELLVATNNHVITGANTITVTFIDESSVEAQVKGTDAANDLAVVAVALADMDADTLSKIKVATLGNSDDLVVGEQVVAIGNALGYGQSVTSGYVSALNREVTVEDVTAHLIQTDAAINPGNSGGALLNMSGELIGINAVKFASSEVEGMGYAIPVSTAEPILDDLMNRETRSKVGEDQASYLGITCRNVTAEIQQMYNLPSGVFVDTVTEGSASEKAGMIKGDIITKFDGTTISSYEELVNTLQYYPAGETVEIVVMRAESGEYKEVELTVTLDAKPKE